jgi:hypothetical protein
VSLKLVSECAKGISIPVHMMEETLVGNAQVGFAVVIDAETRTKFDRLRFGDVHVLASDCPDRAGAKLAGLNIGLDRGVVHNTFIALVEGLLEASFWASSAVSGIP